MKTVVTRPYEFLVRWRDGVISGAHIGFEDSIVEDGKTVSVSPLPVVSVAVAGATGFPLNEILDQIHIDAINERDAAIATIDALRQEIAALKKPT